MNWQDTPLPNGYTIIGLDRHTELTNSPFNPDLNGQENENRFTEEFANELANVKTKLHSFFEKYGVCGSLERSENGLSSDWWINCDHYSTSRDVFVDLLNPKLQSRELITALQNEIATFDNDWMIILSHDNAYDATGEFTGKPGEYSIWVSPERVEIYSERVDDVQNLLDSLNAG